VLTVSESCSGRLVDDTFYIKTRDTAGVFRCLSLSIVEVSRNCNNGFLYRLTEVVFSGFLHLLEDLRGDLLWRILFAVNLHPRIAVLIREDFERSNLMEMSHFLITVLTTDEAFYAEESFSWIRHG